MRGIFALRKDRAHCRLGRYSLTNAMTDHPDKVLIVDFGAQYTQLIARRVREAGVYSEIVPFDKAEAALKPVLPKAIILSGGPASVHETGTPQLSPAVANSGVPILGICYGEQAMVAALGGQVEGGHSPRIRPRRASRSPAIRRCSTASGAQATGRRCG